VGVIKQVVVANSDAGLNPVKAIREVGDTCPYI
jgi:hypothetical protein